MKQNKRTPLYKTRLLLFRVLKAYKSDLTTMLQSVEARKPSDGLILAAKYKKWETIINYYKKKINALDAEIDSVKTSLGE